MDSQKDRTSGDKLDKPNRYKADRLFSTLHASEQAQFAKETMTELGRDHFISLALFKRVAFFAALSFFSMMLLPSLGAPKIISKAAQLLELGTWFFLVACVILELAVVTPRRHELYSRLSEIESQARIENMVSAIEEEEKELRKNKPR